MKKTVFISLMAFLTMTQAQFDNVATSAATFLKIGVGGRGVALGGAHTASVNDASAMYWNPAGINGVNGQELVFHQSSMYDGLGLQHSYLGAVVQVGSSNRIGLSINHLSYGDMTRTTEFSPEGEGQFTASDIAIGLAFGTRVSDRFRIGIQTKLVRETISFSSASALAIDIGSQYTTAINGLELGMAITNFGTKMRLFGTDQKLDVDPYEDLDGNPDVIARLATEDWALPMSFQFGLSWMLMGENAPIKNPNISIMTNVEYTDPRDFNPVYHFGTEITVMKMVQFRAGLRNQFLRYPDDLDDASEKMIADYEEGEYINRMSFGIGIPPMQFPYTVYKFSVDYSFNDVGLLGDTQQLTITVGF